MNKLAFLVAIILFAIAAFGGSADIAGSTDLVALGLAAFAAGHLLKS